MSCVLRAVGVNFDVDAFLRDSPFTRASIFHRGEPRIPAVADSKQRSASGFNLPVSEAGFDNPDGQIQDVGRFLREHEDELRRLSGFPGLEEVCLDFGIERRDVAAQTDVFPADLLWQTGALDIDLVVTHYAVGEDPEQTPDESR
jgi:hypothetical protein